MEIQYVIINFLILLILLFIVGRKTVKRLGKSLIFFEKDIIYPSLHLYVLL